MPASIDSNRLLNYIECLLPIHAPSGSEQEADTLMRELLGDLGDSTWQDSAGNIIVHIHGQRSDAPIAAIAHKDEISLMVKRVEEDGRLRVTPVGGLHPWAIGETPVEIMARDALLPGVLSIGAKHVSRESPAGMLKEGSSLTWENMWIETKQSAQQLGELGVRAGTRVVIARHLKNLWHMGDYLCGYNLDCRAGLAAMLEAGMQLAENKPAQDVYLVASSSEEIGGQGATYALGKLPVDTAIAIDIAPAAIEYGTKNSDEPILIEKDARGVYHELTNQHLESLAQKHGFGVQKAVVTSYASDSSIARANGLVARSALIGYPGDNTHGYEICAREGVFNTARLLLAYLLEPSSP
jgi:putative aminopeptidase FrvX